MKTVAKKITVLALSFALLVGAPLASRRYEAQAQLSEIVGVTLSLFSQMLNPYGSWFELDNYGPVWRPSNISYGWQPYQNGRWYYTDYGMTWQSYDPWGDATYRYGSWVNDDDYGWVWVPGYTWAPAWVTWQYSNDYVGWAPLPPNYQFDYSGGYNYYNQPIGLNYDNYVFVPANQITSPYIQRVRLPLQRNYDIIRYARPVTTYQVVNGYVVNPGPNITVVERIRRNRVPLRQILRSERLAARRLQAIEGNRVQVAMPNITRREAQRYIRNINRQGRIDRVQQFNQNRLERQRARDQFELQRQQQRQQNQLQRQQVEQQRRLERQQLRTQEFEQRRQAELQRQQLREQQRQQRLQFENERERVQQQRRLERQQQRNLELERQRQADIQRQQERLQRQQLRQQQQQQEQLQRARYQQQLEQQREAARQQRQQLRQQQQLQFQQQRQQFDRQQRQQLRQQQNFQRQQQNEQLRQQRRELRRQMRNQ